MGHILHDTNFYDAVTKPAPLTGALPPKLPEKLLEEWHEYQTMNAEAAAVPEELFTTISNAAVGYMILSQMAKEDPIELLAELLSSMKGN